MAPRDILLCVDSVELERKSLEQPSQQKQQKTKKRVRFSAEILQDDRSESIEFTEKEKRDCYYKKSELRVMRSDAAIMARHQTILMERAEDALPFRWNIFCRPSARIHDVEDNKMLYMRGLELISDEYNAEFRRKVAHTVAVVLRQQLARKDSDTIAMAYTRRCTRCTEEALERARFDAK
mmetsp:Transcript_8669/g.20049  ORF Transcript_8669/g.20049 Transcript_8669/m.20049 type:complete len:180 (+) Transcript_8669:46-585(+)